MEHCTSDPAHESDYKIGKLVPPPLISNYTEVESCDVISKKREVQRSLAGGLPSDESDSELPLLGALTAYQKTVCETESVKLLLKYLQANENPPEYPVCKQRRSSRGPLPPPPNVDPINISFILWFGTRLKTRILPRPLERII